MALLRVIIMPLLILAFLVASFSGRLVFRSETGRRVYHRQITSFFSSLALRVLRINVNINGQGAESVPDAALFVCNHLSYLDILVMAAHFPGLFITSMEVKHTPVLGLLAEMGGSLFIERRNRDNIDGEIATIANALQQGFRVTLYPEGTSSDGQSVLPFKRSLIQSALDAHVPVQPFALAYSKINDQPFGDINRDRVCWYGSMSFLPHFLSLFRVSRIQTQLHVLPAVYPGCGDTRKDICDLVQTAIRQTYHSLTPEQNRRPDGVRSVPSELHIG